MRHRPASIGTALWAAVALTGLAAAATAATEPDYHLPAPAGTALVVTQGNQARWQAASGRVAAERFAFDFAAADRPERFPVLAARGGTVIGVQSGVRGGNCEAPLDGDRPDCWRRVNYVLIDHGDGTSGLYLHLKRGAPPVKRGQVVSAGQPIGGAGRSGWTDRVGMQFQVQETPTWDQVGRPGWFLTRSLPVTFADADVAAQRSDRVPRTGDTVISGNPGAAFEPFRFRRRPVDLPAAVPFEVGAERPISAAYDAGSPDGYGLHFAAAAEPAAPGPGDPVSSVTEPASAAGSTEVRPLFAGEVVFAGCATGESAALGPTVVVSRAVGEETYLGVLGHLSDIEPSLLRVDPEGLTRRSVGPNDVLGHYGAASAAGRALECPAADPAATELFATILQGATVSADGEIAGGTPVSPEPLVGERGYEGLTWWPGPVAAVTMAEEPGRPRATWNRRTTPNASHVPFGDTVTLRARVRDVVDIAEVRFRAWYQRWPRVVPSGALVSFQPAGTWRELALCKPPGFGSGSDCTWSGDTRDALVTYRWDPTVTETQDIEAWLPRARTAMSRSTDRCIPVSLAVEIVDTAGQVYSQTEQLPRPTRCDARAAEARAGSRLVYLDPLVPPRPPTPRGAVEDRGWPPSSGPDPLKGAIVWRDRSDNEDGFRIYARRSWLEVDCSITDGPWQVVTELGPDRERYRPRHAQVVRSIEVPRIEGVPGSLVRWEYAVAAFNEAGDSSLVPVGGFVGGGEGFCDPGLEPPPDL